MEQQQEQGLDAGLSGDYGYDMAHDFASADMASGRPGDEKHRAVYVPTETSDIQEDLSYDLAHDVPAQGRATSAVPRD